MLDCASNFAIFEMPSRDGKSTYEVEIGGESYTRCPCRGFHYRQNCHHLEELWRGACFYNPQWHDGREDPEYTPKSYTHPLVEGERCPACGGPMVAVLRAV